MTLTWRTLRDYALRFASGLGVTLVAVSIPIAPLALAIYLMRYYWLTFVVSHAEAITWTLIIVYFALTFSQLVILYRWRRDWLWRRFWIDVGR